MALYLVGDVLVSAKNGHHARDLTGDDDSPIRRIKEDEPWGVIGDVVDVTTKEMAPPRAEIETTFLEDRGVRRFQDMETGETRTEED